MRAIGFTLAKLLRISNLRNTHLSVNYVHVCIMAVSVQSAIGFVAVWLAVWRKTFFLGYSCISRFFLFLL